MATYSELHDLFNDSTLLDKVEAAVVIAAQGIIGGAETNQAQRDKWAEQALSNTRDTAEKMLPAIVAANKGITADQIKNAADSAIQTNVDATVNLFADLIV